jgi:hypothetical protein
MLLQVSEDGFIDSRTATDLSTELDRVLNAIN